MGEVNFVLTDHGEHGIGISSPQIPGLVAGVASFEEVTPSYLLALARETSGAVEAFVVHVERVLQFEGQTFVVRCRHDFGTSQRARIAEGLARELEASPEFREGWPRNSLGDVVLAAALAGDRVGAIADAEQADEPVIAVFPYGDDFKAVGIQAPDEHDRVLSLEAFVDRLTGRESEAAGLREFALA